MSVTALSQSGARSGRTGWKTTGWQGIRLQTPSSWNLVAFSGERTQGSLRLDNGDPGTATGIEIRWSQIKGRITDADIEKRLKRYFVGIERSVKRQKIKVEATSKLLTDDLHAERDLSRSFSWRADRRATGRIWHCTQCGRLVIAQVLGAQGGLSSAATDVLRSLECHPEQTGWQTWSLYDLLSQVPADYQLRGKPQLMNIYVQLLFGRGQSTDTLAVEQWGVANVQLRGAYLDEWFRGKNSAQEPMVSYQPSPTVVHGHEALLLTGRRTGLSYWSGQAMPQMLRLQRPALHYHACLWECPDSNKIHLVQSFSRRPQPDLVREIVERTPCH